jgi:hypothetical protein
MTINRFQAQVIDELREAASEHGAVDALLRALSRSHLYLPGGDTKFTGSEYEKTILIAAIVAGEFRQNDLGIDWHIEG